MRISCVLDADQLSTAISTPDVIVFPEGISETEIQKACSIHPHSIVVAAVTDNSRSRGVLLHRGRNQIDYLKVATDCRTLGSGNIQQVPVYTSRDVCIGVLICMDVDHVAFSQSVIAAVKSSESQLKLLCLPADMGAYWFSGDTVSPRFEGLHVILCNHKDSSGQMQEFRDRHTPAKICRADLHRAASCSIVLRKRFPCGGLRKCCKNA